MSWDVPAGKWTVLRIGHTSTGKDNHPAPASGRGLECDKLSKEAVDAMFAGLMGKIIADSPAAGRQDARHHAHRQLGSRTRRTGRRGCARNSSKRRGYDLLPLLARLHRPHRR